MLNFRIYTEHVLWIDSKVLLLSPHLCVITCSQYYYVMQTKIVYES